MSSDGLFAIRNATVRSFIDNMRAAMPAILSDL